MTTRLVDSLQMIVLYDRKGDYEQRNRWVFHALADAVQEGMSAGVRIDPRELQWPVVFILLPTGQVSWHVPQFEAEWDGHDTDEKNRRCLEYATGSLLAEGKTPCASV